MQNKQRRKRTTTSSCIALACLLERLCLIFVVVKAIADNFYIGFETKTTHTHAHTHTRALHNNSAKQTQFISSSYP
jgi:hypothetical protein